MTLNFPADPSLDPIYEAPNGVTYIWNDSIQSWVVKSVDYDGDYVNRIGDTMSGNLNFEIASSPIGLDWGGNPKLSFVNGGDTQLIGNYVVTGGFKFTSNGINFTHEDTHLKYRTSTRIRFVDDRTAFAYGGSQMMTITSDGVEYQGNFIKDNNVVTVKYVATEVENLQDQIDTLTTELESTIEDLIDQKAVLLTGNQTVEGNKIFHNDIVVSRISGDNTGSDAKRFVIARQDNKGDPYFWVTDKGRVHVKTKENNANAIFPETTEETQVINKKYADINLLKSVSGTANTNDDTGVRTNAKSDGNQKIYMMKATKDQYGVNVRGLLPQGNSDPGNDALKVGQMYFNNSTKRVLIRVN